MTKVEGYNIATNTLGMEPSAPLEYALGLEPHRFTMIILGGR